MPPGDEYAPLGGGGGKLKLKGNKVNDGRIEKKKKKKEKKKTAESSANTTEGERETEGDSSTRREKDSSGAEAEEGGGGAGGKEGAGPGGEIVVGKTEAEKRYEEQRRKRVCTPFLSVLAFPGLGSFTVFLPSALRLVLHGVKDRSMCCLEFGLTDITADSSKTD